MLVVSIYIIYITYINNLSKSYLVVWGFVRFEKIIPIRKRFDHDRTGYRTDHTWIDDWFGLF